MENAKRTSIINSVLVAVIKGKRDNGDRNGRQVGRPKDLIANWGIERFRGEGEE